MLSESGSFVINPNEEAFAPGQRALVYVLFALVRVSIIQITAQRGLLCKLFFPTPYIFVSLLVLIALLPFYSTA